MVGPEFLVWIPSEECFATFFCGSKTLKKEARKFGTRLMKACTLKSKLIVQEPYRWHGPVTTDCSDPNLAMYDPEQFKKEVHKFKNPVVKDKGEPIEEPRGEDQEDAEEGRGPPGSESSREWSA